MEGKGRGETGAVISGSVTRNRYSEPRYRLFSYIPENAVNSPDTDVCTDVAAAVYSARSPSVNRPPTASSAMYSAIAEPASVLSNPQDVELTLRLIVSFRCRSYDTRPSRRNQSTKYGPRPNSFVSLAYVSVVTSENRKTNRRLIGDIRNGSQNAREPY